MKLKNWFTEKNNNHVVLCGEVYDDETHKYADGDLVRTSYIKDVTEENGAIIAVTFNSQYELAESYLQEIKITYDGGQKNYEFVWK